MDLASAQMPDLDPAACRRVLETRDPRFDGRFFIGVRSTGVYCRPICPARPKPENCVFFACAAAAQECGYRPCLRCRPEASPGTPAWLGTSATVSRALRLIGEGALDRGGVDALAERLGIGGRHLRRLFVRHLGATPVAVAQTRRLLFAKKLLDETRLPISQVALAAGYSSVRRFNAALSQSYGRTPRDLRREAEAGAGTRLESGIDLRLPYRAPFQWDALLAFLALRAIPGVEEVSGERYRRVIALGEVRGLVEVRNDAERLQLVARIRLSTPAPLVDVAGRLRHMFDLGADPVEIGAHLRRDPALRRAWRDWPGLRVPGAWDGFELAVRAILGQQVSVKGATTLAGRLVARYGEPIGLETPDDAAHSTLRFSFPRCEVLARARVESIGLPRARAQTIRGLARAVASGALSLDGPLGLDRSVEALRELRGIGDWTAQYVAMRALREPDAFPAGDLGLRKALAAADGGLPSERALRERAEAWRPWRAYAALALWQAGAGTDQRPAQRQPARPPRGRKTAA